MTKKSRFSQSKLKTILVVLLVITTMLLPSLPVLAYNVTTDFNYTIGPEVLATCTGDGAPTVIRDGGYTYVAGHNNSTGAPAMYRGSSFDSLVQQPDGILDSSFSKPYGDDVYWLNGAGWVDGTGKWYVVTHIEFNNNYFTAPMKRIGLSSSPDHGAHWHYEGDILTSDNSYDRSMYNNYYDFGCGEPYLFVDNANGYFYIAYMDTWWSVKTPGEYHSTVRMARCAISDKLAPGKWKKFYNGTWNEAGLGGRATDVFPNSSGCAITYSTYLNKYIFLTTKLFSGNDTAGSYMASCTDLSQQNWTKLQKVSDICDHYNTFVTADGTAGANSTNVGTNFRWYYTHDTGAHYRTITLSSGSVTNIGMSQQRYPVYTVNDGNKNWDMSYTTMATSFSDSFSDGIPTGWTTYDGTWTESGGVYSVNSGTGTGYRSVVEDKWFDNFTYDADVQIANTSYNAGLIFRATGNDYGCDNYRGYYVGLSGNSIILGKSDTSASPYQDGHYTQLASSAVSISADTFYHIKVVADSNNIRVYFNNKTVPCINYFDDSFSIGTIGLRAYQTAVVFDNVSVTLNMSHSNAYSLRDDYSATQGGNNWYYMQWNGSSYSNMTWDAAHTRWQGAYTYNRIWLPGQVHPDTNDSVVAWKAPASGNYRISGNPKMANSGTGSDGVNVKIMKNTTQIWPSSGWQYIAGNDTTGVTNDVTVSLAANDMVYFIVNKNGNNTSDETTWIPSIRIPLTCLYDFNDGNSFGWTTYDGTWTVSSGAYTVNSGVGYKSVMDGSNYSNVTYEADVKLATVTGNLDGGLIFRVNNPTVGCDSYQGYYVGFRNGYIHLGKANNNWTEIANASVTANPDTFYHLKIVANGSNLQVFFNNSPTPCINVNDSTWTSGAIGVRVYQTAATFDNISVTGK